MHKDPAGKHGVGAARSPGRRGSQRPPGSLGDYERTVLQIGRSNCGSSGFLRTLPMVRTLRPEEETKGREETPLTQTGIPAELVRGIAQFGAYAATETILRVYLRVPLFLIFYPDRLLVHPWITSVVRFDCLNLLVVFFPFNLIALRVFFCFYFPLFSEFYSVFYFFIHII